MPLSDSPGVSDGTSQLDGDVLSCRFSREAAFSVEYDSVTYDFDLNSLPYVLLMAGGSYRAGEPRVIGYHGFANRVTTPTARSISDSNEFVDSPDPIATFYQECDGDKGCFGIPRGCPSTQDCEVRIKRGYTTVQTKT